MIPLTVNPFRFSKPALAIILASSLLALILTVSTIRNLNREQSALENFLLQEGLTLIRSFEAGARTTMRHHMAGVNLLQTLVEETAKEKSNDHKSGQDRRPKIRARDGLLSGRAGLKDL